MAHLSAVHKQYIRAALRQLTVSQRKQQRATAATMKITVDV